MKNKKISVMKLLQYASFRSKYKIENKTKIEVKI